jgi:hypothetical protein
MSEYGAGLTVTRKDGVAVDEEEAEGLVARMERLARAADRCGAFEEEPDCGLGWEEDGGGYTLVVTSSYGYHHSTPEEVMEDATEHDLDYARWLAGALEAELPGVYAYEADFHEW